MANRGARTAGALQVAGLFAGIGGIELGLQSAGHEASLLCEADPGAARILAARFPDVELNTDVRDLSTLGDADLVART
jgi:DNA (cytosine-5)-methyltransferase 1